jgi:hypothetical protein
MDKGTVTSLQKASLRSLRYLWILCVTLLFFARLRRFYTKPHQNNFLLQIKMLAQRLAWHFLSFHSGLKSKRLLYFSCHQFQGLANPVLVGAAAHGHERAG